MGCVKPQKNECPFPISVLHFVWLWSMLNEDIEHSNAEPDCLGTNASNKVICLHLERYMEHNACTCSIIMTTFSVICGIQ
jgi:hypothetical protein